MSHGTFRNKIGKLRKSDEVELCYYSSCAFYSLKGHKFSKSMTQNHTMVSSNNPFYRLLQNLPLDRQSIHNIRMKFKLPGIWSKLSINSDFQRNKRSNDIVIPAWNKDNAIVKVVIHKTDTVTVISGVL